MTAIVWGVKASLLEYLADLGDATTTCSDGAEVRAGGGFRWPAEADGGGWRGRGTVRFEAHGRMLDIRLASPLVLLEDGRARVEVAHGGRDLGIATGELLVQDSRALVASLVVTPAGSRLLGDVYPPGTRLDDLVVER